MKQKVLIAGGSGSLGLAIADHLSAQGYEVLIFTRAYKPNMVYEQIFWDGKTPRAFVDDAFKDSILINLAGELVDRVPTKENIELLTSSRVEPTRVLAEFSEKYGRPKLWLQMSTLAIYGDAGEQILTEESPAADGPAQMAGVAKAWESEVNPSLADRLVVMRTAVVLQPNTPALNRLVTITKMFMGGQVGNGRQWFSWIHYKDFLKAIDFLIKENVEGIVHLTSPEPVRNKELMANLRKVLHKSFALPTPKIAITVGAWLLFRTDPQLAITGRKVLPKKLLDTGFSFDHPSLTESLEDLLLTGR
jgi:uncharacterized protein (TIGR01777 family)